MDIILYIFKTLKFDNYEAQISLRDPANKEKYIGSDENWHLVRSDTRCRILPDAAAARGSCAGMP